MVAVVVICTIHYLLFFFLFQLKFKNRRLLFSIHNWQLDSRVYKMPLDRKEEEETEKEAIKVHKTC